MRPVIEVRPAGQPILTIFTVPTPFLGADDVQIKAIMSWMHLDPTPNVVLLGNHPSFYSMASQFPSHVSVEPNLECNVNGIPLFSSVFARSHAVKTTFSSIVRSDAILLQDILEVARFSKVQHSSFVMMAPQWEANSSRPLLSAYIQQFASTAQNRTLQAGEASNTSAWAGMLRGILKKAGRLQVDNRVGVWLWDMGVTPLIGFNQTMPPFAYDRGYHDRWLAKKIAVTSNATGRVFLDGSSVVTCFSSLPFIPTAMEMATQPPAVEEPSDSLQHAELAESQSKSTGRRLMATSDSVYPVSSTGTKDSALGERRWRTDKGEIWEFLVNDHICSLQGTVPCGPDSRAFLHIVPCSNNASHAGGEELCAVPSNCSCSEADPSGSQLASQGWACNLLSLPTRPRAQPRAIWTNQLPPEDMLSLDSLLARVATPEKVVTLVAATRPYFPMLMSFVCNLRLIGLPAPLVAALDDELFQLALAHGLPVFREDSAPPSRIQNDRKCIYGTRCFQKMTKVKSRAVLALLQRGYHVLWSDVDIVWFRNPLPHLLTYGPGIFPVQSDEADQKKAANGAGSVNINGFINSGFYLARSEPNMIEAFTEIVEHAAMSNRSEQPSFYNVLCGPNGELTRGQDRCVWKDGRVVVNFLDRRQYPNGLVWRLWLRGHPGKRCQKMGCLSLHNNWIPGKDAKEKRTKKFGLWFYDGRNNICKFRWHPEMKGRNNDPFKFEPQYVHNLNFGY